MQGYARRGGIPELCAVKEKVFIGLRIQSKPFGIRYMADPYRTQRRRLTKALNTHGAPCPVRPPASSRAAMSATPASVPSPIVVANYRFPPVPVPLRPMRVLVPKQRYTAEEDLFIRLARAEHIPWNMIATVLKERYQHGDSRNSKNLQVHYSQKINATAAPSDALTSDETLHLNRGLTTRLNAFYTGVADEFSRTTLRIIDAEFVRRYMNEWAARSLKDLEGNLELARAMAIKKSNEDAESRKRDE